MILGDLIQVPPIRTVIQLADTQRPELHEELLDHFVFTQDITHLFQRLLHALAQPRGLGVFLKGHYGSGKSHCLAFLHQLLAGNPRAWQRLPPQLQPSPVKECRWIMVSVPLFAYSAEHTLEQVVLQALEDELARHLEQPLVLAEATRLLEHFRTYVLPVYPDRLFGFENLPDSQALQRARQFLRELPDNPLRLSYDRRQAMTLLADALGDFRVVLLLDELSEFLRSKDPHSSAHREDVRFLQFLGEWSDKLPLWIVASLQHSLEELGYGEESSALRIRERYPLRFHLSSRHVGDLIGGRLIQHKPDAAKSLNKIWHDLERIYPGLISQADFLRTYPVHPTTLELLEQLTPLFSRQRGMVDFVHAQVAGDPLRGWEGMLAGPADQLLTAERLFDHFRERFSDRAELAAYETTCWAYFEKELPVLFEQEKERQLAAAVVKVLILAAISPVPLETSAERLSLMLARRLSRIDPKTNLAFLQEKVLDVLVQRGAYVLRRGQQYVLDLQANLNQILGQRVRQVRQQQRPDWEAAALLVNRPELSLADVVGRPPQAVRVRWRHANREGLWAWLAAGEVQSQLLNWQALLDSDKYDCCLVLLSPALGETESVIASLASQPSMVVWQPARPEAELEELLAQWQAHRTVLEQDAELRSRLQPLVTQMEQRLEQRIYSLYARGKLHWAGQQGHPPCHEVRFDRLYSAAVAAGLELRFPQFGSIAPRADGLTPKHLESLWKDWIEPGGAALNPVVEAVLAPLRLLEGERLALIPGGPAQAMLASWQPEQRYNVQNVRRQWQKSAWGLVPAQFYLILAALVQLGKIQLISHGRAFTLSSMGELLGGKAEELEVLSARALPALEQLQGLNWLFAGLPLVPLNPNKIRDLWREARPQLDHLLAVAEGLRLELSHSPALPGLPHQRLRERAEDLTRALQKVGQPHSSLQGLHALIEADFQRFQGVAQELEGWLEFLRHQAKPLQQLRRRLDLLGQASLVGELDGLLDSPQPWQEFSQVREKAQRYENERAALYRQKHDSYYRTEVFAYKRTLTQLPEWRALEALNRVLGFSCQPSFASLRQRAESLPTACRRNVEDQLLLALACSCGYEMDQPLPEVQDMGKEVLQALVTGCQDLLKRDLGSYLRALRATGQERVAHHLEMLLQCLEDLIRQPSHLQCIQLLELLDPNSQQHLSKALTGQTLLVVRPLQELMDILQDQRLPASRLRALFEEWLQGSDLHSDAWVHVQAGDARDPAGAGPWLARWLDQHELDVTPALARRYQLKGEADGEPPQEELWPLLQELSASLDPARAAVRERIFEGLSCQFCERAVLAGVPADWGQRLPTLAWPHLTHYRQLAGWLQSSDFFSAARAWRDYQKLTYEQDGFPDLTEILAQRVQRHPPEAVPLGQVPQRLLQDCPQPWVIVVVDGLRWDLWDLLRALWEERLGPPLRELLARSPLPSSTRSARHAWLGGEELTPAGADGLLLGRPLTLLKSAEDKRKRKQVEELLLQGPPALMLHVQFIDRRVHESQLELWPLYRELLAEAEARLIPLLQALPPGRAVLMLSDHGFRDPGPHPAHGGDHWQEVFVPAALWRT
ncbi:hypothetical protein IV102_00925 [bacterium]|nr:hypothetical protein [bacterium]